MGATTTWNGTKRRSGAIVAIATIALAASAVVACHASATPPPAATCAIDEVAQDDGTCLAPGVPPAMCAAGFVADGQGGCVATLPPADCPDGTMAVPGQTTCTAVGPTEPPTCAAGALALPGEAACHAIEDCGAAPWGAIPVDATTQHVDLAYAGGASDGSATKPWTRIQAAIDAAAPGAVIAIAAGRYAESLTASAKPVKLWGRCPSLVSVATSAGASAFTLAAPAAAGSELHGLSLTGDGAGVTVAAGAGASGAALDHVWIHDTTGRGVDALSAISITQSLIEATTGDGVHVEGAPVVVRASLIRGVKPQSDDGSYGCGIGAHVGAGVELHGSVLEGCHTAGLLAVSSDATVDGSVIRDTQAEVSDTSFGHGIEFNTIPAPGDAHRTLAVSDTLVARSRTAGILIGGNVGATLQRVRVTGTQPRPRDGKDGEGLTVTTLGLQAGPPTASVSDSLFEHNQNDGVLGQGSELVLTRVVVRDTTADATALLGLGVAMENDRATARRGKLTMSGSLVERNQVVGVFLEGSDGELEATLVRGTLPRASDRHLGLGVQAGTPGSTPSTQSTLTMRGCAILGNRSTGILVDDGQADIEATVVEATSARAADGAFGVGIVVQDLAAPFTATLSLRASLVRGNRYEGVDVTNGTATIERTWIDQTASSLSDGSAGDGIGAWASKVTVTGSRVTANARSGVLAFGSRITLATSRVACNAFDLDGESAAIAPAPYSFDVSGGVACACGADASVCQVLSSNLQAPAQLGVGG